ncbi:cysteine hydrolase family protein [Ectobacillus ponti]|uniref:Cysteine hydrolase n=1 Tax=Ectobacillus ponti TaxID=2961894 RepID=A0AA41XFV0_9BACI|nr:isochorismatase family cysteine hydrolase [Ectobacillus ponti]MCP8971356.1 cysteine hydrolase [Ectobacillus ponti]
MKNTALLLIDLINDFRFDHGHILAEKCRAMLPSIMRLKEKARSAGIPIIYINDHYGIWKADLQEIVTYCRNEQSNSIIDHIHPEASDYFLIKPHYSAFYETPLNSLLGYLQVKNLIVAGVAGNICVLFTANDAHMRHYNLYIPSDCIASNHNQDTEHALRVMEQIMKAKVQSSAELMLSFV